MTRARDIADQQDNLGGAVPPFAAGKNKIINGDCYWNQRNFSSQTLTTESSVYIVDRIYGVNVLSGSTTFSVQQFTPGTAPASGYEAKQFVRAVSTGQSSGFAGTIFNQAIEDVRTFAGQTITVSFWAKAASGTPNVSIEMVQIFGTGGSPSGTIEAAGGAQKFAISTSWTRYSKTITLPSISGKTLGTNNNSFLACSIWCSAGVNFNSRTDSLGIQSNTFDIWGLQVEAGSAATPFQTASGSIGGELALCQRYYWRTQNVGSSGPYLSPLGSAYSGNNVNLAMPNPVPMRVAPTSIDYANVYLYDGINNPSISNIGLDGTTYGSNLQSSLNVTSSSLTQFRPYWIRASNSSGYLGLSAEF